MASDAGAICETGKAANIVSVTMGDAVRRGSSAALVTCLLLGFHGCATYQLWEWARTEEPVHALHPLAYRELEAGGAALTFAPRDPARATVQSVRIPAGWSSRPVVLAGAAWRLTEPFALRLEAAEDVEGATATLTVFAAKLDDDVPRFDPGPPALRTEERYTIGWMPIEFGTRFAVFGRLSRSPDWVCLGKLDVIAHPLDPTCTALAIAATPVTAVWDLITTQNCRTASGPRRLNPLAGTATGSRRTSRDRRRRSRMRSQ